MKLIADIKKMGDVMMLQSKTPYDIDDGTYQVEIKKIGRKRTLRQNAMLWKLICEIAKEEDGNLRNVDDLYCHLLEQSGAKYEVLYGTHEAIQSLKESEIIRHIKVVKQEVVRHKVIDTAIVFYGSSKMDTKEMSQLIDTTLDYASQLGLETDFWRNVLYE